MDEETVILAVNAALEAGDWARVSCLTADLYSLAVQSGETAFADLVQDLHWIANDALAHPLEVGVMIAP